MLGAQTPFQYQLAVYKSVVLDTGNSSFSSAGVFSTEKRPTNQLGRLASAWRLCKPWAKYVEGQYTSEQ